ncbi:MAG TPA: NrfD/PsrC family molybdoenzyme membrane anchor subunit [Candidatus Sulfomarinibacteraceae bacterium]|nr:NrfD/PsrC family molybdoenzyme membrane anchor subunit [Candidatus Sulfomarinibacteraceae bacterium]
MDIEREEPIVEPGQTYGSITEHISSIALERRTRLLWLFGFGLSSLLLLVLLVSVGWLLLRGTGIWGINVPVAWGFAIINFVWWIGIAHAGTLISAVLLVLRQEWRTSINRFAEAMTLFALASAALFPLLHLGRPWLFYYMLPYPNSMGLWPQFRSPLVWDMFSILTYGVVSGLFWYVGLIPDLAKFRDRAARPLARKIYGFLAMGWRGSAVHWRRYEAAYFMLAVLATLVVSVHGIVGLAFGVSLVPGWHTTIAPPYFVVGAVFSGFALVLVLAIPLRRIYDLEDFITMRHLDNMAKVILGASLFLAYGYLMHFFTAWYSADEFELAFLRNRFQGPYAPYFWAAIALNVLLPQIFWFRSLRRNTILLFIVSLFALAGMWLDRFVIVVASLQRDFLPSAWELYVPTIWDWATFLGTIGLFFMLLFLFIRFLPIISIFEMQELVSEEAQQ